jgi:hypothetical protein
MKSRLDSLPSEHGDHMLILSIKKNRRSRHEGMIPQIEKQQNKFDFALNTQINCQGDLSPGVIMEK